MKRNPILAFLLSILPGLGHLYAGQLRRALIFFTVDAFILVTLFLSRDSIITQILLGVVYLITVIPTGMEAAQFAKGKPSTGGFLESKGFIIAMLLTTGFAAVPLLWDSRSFTKKGKIVWTVTVTVLAILFFTFLRWVGPQLEHILEELKKSH